MGLLGSEEEARGWDRGVLDEDEDVFGHCEGLGAAAYAPVVSEAASAASEEVREQPKCKKARTSAQQAVRVDASLEGLEARLEAIGETPRFAAAQPGRLQHACKTAEAWVNFWPTSLRWNVEGRHRSRVEEARLAPVAPCDEMQPS